MNELQIFTNTEFGELSIMTVDGKIMFPATECARVLGYVNPADAIRRHTRWVVKHEVPHPQNPAKTLEVNFINEGDLYRLIVNSSLPSAERFERWVFDEVLPAIRKHGAYMTEATIDKVIADPDFGIRLLTQLKREQEAHKVTALQLEEKRLQLDEAKEWLTVKRVASLNGKHWKTFDWRRLKNTSNYLGYPVKRVFDANYGHVCAYHIDAWKYEYSGYRFP